MTAQQPRFRVWHIPQIPGTPFHADVASPEEGFALADTLARYDMFALEHGVRSDFGNANGVEVFVGGEWVSVDPEDMEDGMRFWEQER